MMDYLFSLLGSLCLTGYAYHRAAKEAGAAKKSCWLFRLGLLAGFFCLTAGTGREPLPFYTVMAWPFHIRMPVTASSRAVRGAVSFRSFSRAGKPLVRSWAAKSIPTAA